MKDNSFITKGLFPPANVKSFMYKRRFIALWEKTKRNDVFKKQKINSFGEPTFYLKNVEWFLCCTDRICKLQFKALIFVFKNYI